MSSLPTRILCRKTARSGLRNLNTFRNFGVGRRRLFRWAVAGLAAVCLEVSAFAIDPNRMVSQYLHDSWGTEKGFPGGSVSPILQTSDGYLSVGTNKSTATLDTLNF